MCAIKICKISIIVYFSVVFTLGFVYGSIIDDPLLYEMYKTYLQAQEIDEGTVSARRVFSNNRNYDIHVMKLDEVNGKKRHNLLVKESNASNPLIYINNPVETKVPNAYLTLEEFKKELTDRVMNIRHQFDLNTDNNIGNKKTSERDRYVTKFKYFLERLMSIRNQKKANITEVINARHNISKLKLEVKNKIISANVTKVTKVSNPVFRIFTLKTDADKTDVKKIKNDTQLHINKGTVAKSEDSEASTVKVDPTDSTTTAAETSIESPMKTEVTEAPTAPATTEESLTEVTESLAEPGTIGKLLTDVTESPPEPATTKESLRQRMDSTTEIKTESTPVTTTTISTTASEISKPTRSTLGRPAVWVDTDDRET